MKLGDIERRRALEKLRGGGARKPAKRKGPTVRVSDAQRALLTMLEEPEGGSLYMGSRQWARILKTEPKGPEGPQHWAAITPAGAKALKGARMRLMDATLAHSLASPCREALLLVVDASNEGGAALFDTPSERASLRKLESLGMVTVIDKLPATSDGDRREQWIAQATRYGGNVAAYLQAKG